MTDEIIKIESTSDMCRICLGTSLDTVNLFDEIFDVSYLDKLTTCIPKLNITQDDPFPKIICMECCDLLEHAFEFHNLCIKSDRQLREVVVWEHPSDSSIKSEVEEVSNGESIPRRKRGKKVKELVKKRSKRRAHAECYDEKGKYIRNRERQYKCIECDRTFHVQQSLNNHMSVHTGELPFTCEICGKSFSQRTSIMLHLKTHSSETMKNLKCNKCSYRTLYSSHLQRHASVHTNELPFACSICGKRTKNKQQVATHVKNVHSTLSLPCEFCGKIFRTNSSLRKHIERHSSSSILKVTIDNIHFSGSN